MNMRQVPVRHGAQITLPKRSYVRELHCVMSNHTPDEFFWWMESVNDEFGIIDRRCKHCGAQC